MVNISLYKVIHLTHLATDFILGGSNNGWLYWKNSNDELINDSLRSK